MTAFKGFLIMAMMFISSNIMWFRAYKENNCKWSQMLSSKEREWRAIFEELNAERLSKEIKELE